MGCVIFGTLVLSVAALTIPSAPREETCVFYACYSVCRPAIFMCMFTCRRHTDACGSACMPNTCVCTTTLLTAVDAGSPLCVCLTFHNCIITRSVSSCKKWVHRNLQHMLRGDRHLPLIMDLGGMASSSGRLESPRHVGRHMLLWVNLIDWMAPNSQVQASSGSQSESVQVRDELRCSWLP